MHLLMRASGGDDLRTTEVNAAMFRQDLGLDQFAKTWLARKGSLPDWAWRSVAWSAPVDFIVLRHNDWDEHLCDVDMALVETRPEYTVARTDCHMVKMTEDGIYFSASGKHDCITVETPRLSWEQLESMARGECPALI